MSDKEIGYAKLLSAAIIGGLIAVVPQVWIAESKLEKKIEQITPAIKGNQVLCPQTTEQFYEFDGRRVYLEMNGKSIEQYFTKNKKQNKLR